ncbi:PAAR-like domain-containing protein [uncultured Desulfobacter sp.]|uniref:PAAR-like domain-containing protein n=1 Tax=uncultured Desulfobacter sp. TaxID=240139 RepID=UPI0029C82582|nr:PAAR-like domain-containing protein [uncultured Desulfobacter sp.]
MANNVFANGMEIACKAAAGKVICAFPDVCMTPPENPATPPGVPVPYPNTAMASDTTKGSKNVKISDKEIMLKNKSYFKTSTGDEAGCAAKKGVISSKNKGKVYFIKWSMNVKVEGENVDRHFDMTTNNHGSPTANEAVPWAYIDSAAMSDTDCKKVVEEKNNCVKKHIKKNASKAAKKRHKKPGVTGVAAAESNPRQTSLVDWDALADDEGSANKKDVQKTFCSDDKCKTKLKCALVPYDGFCCPAPDKEATPPVEEDTPHHIVPKSQFYKSGFAGKSSKAEQDKGAILKDSNGKNKYDPNKAPCICVPGAGHSEGKHGRIHEKTNMKTKTKRGVSLDESIPDGDEWTVGDAEAVGAEAVQEVVGCPKECTEAQLRAGHKTKPNSINKADKVRPTTAGATEDATIGAANV